MEKNKVECSRVNHVIGRAVYPSRSGLGPALVAGDLCSQRVLSWAPSNPAQVAAICVGSSVLESMEFPRHRDTHMTSLLGSCDVLVRGKAKTITHHRFSGVILPLQSPGDGGHITLPPRVLAGQHFPPYAQGLRTPQHLRSGH